MNYFLKFDYQPEIKINADDLIRRIKSKEIPSHAMLKSGNGGEWRPLESYPEFSYLTPPPLPNQQINQSNGSDALNSNSKKLQIPNYFLPVGRINGSIFFFRNIINVISTGLILVVIDLLPKSIQFLGIIPILLYIYLVIVTSSKRLHDWNITGWLSPLVFLPVVPLLLWLIPGNKNSNRYGDRLNCVWRKLFTA